MHLLETRGCSLFNRSMILLSLLYFLQCVLIRTPMNKSDCPCSCSQNPLARHFLYIEASSLDHAERLIEPFHFWSSVFSSVMTFYKLSLDIFHSILAYLAPNDLCHCSRVCRQWYRHSIPLLYRCLTFSIRSDSFYPTTAIQLFSQPPLLNGGLRKSDLILHLREIHIDLKNIVPVDRHPKDSISVFLLQLCNILRQAENLLHIFIDVECSSLRRFDGFLNVWNAIYESSAQRIDLILHRFTSLPSEIYRLMDLVGRERTISLALLVHSINDIRSLKFINPWRNLVAVTLHGSHLFCQSSALRNENIDWRELIPNPSLSMLSLRWLHVHSLPPQLRHLELDYPGVLPVTTWKAICDLVSLTSLSLQFNTKQSQDDWDGSHKFKSENLRRVDFCTKNGDDLLTLLEPILFVCKNLISLSINFKGSVGQNLINSVFTGTKLSYIQIKAPRAEYNFQDLFATTRNSGPVKSLCIPFPSKGIRREHLTLEHAKFFLSCFPMLSEMRFHALRHGGNPQFSKKCLIDGSSACLDRCTFYDETAETLNLYLNQLSHYCRTLCPLTLTRLGRRESGIEWWWMVPRALHELCG